MNTFSHEEDVNQIDFNPQTNTAIAKNLPRPPDNESTPIMNNLKERKNIKDSEKHHEEKPSHQHESYSTTQTLFQHLTTAAQAFIFLYAILIITLCFSDEFVFFTWHPLLLSIGWLFLMSEAILIISKDNIFTGALPKFIRVRLHWILQVVAAVLIIIGFIIVYLNKNYMNKNHFQTWHGLFGLIACASLIPVLLDGIAALYHKDLRNIVSPRISKFVHVGSGIVSFAFGGLALILSVYTKWFHKHTNGNNLAFLVGLVLVSTSIVWTLVRPLLTTASFLKKML